MTDNDHRRHVRRWLVLTALGLVVVAAGCVWVGSEADDTWDMPWLGNAMAVAVGLCLGLALVALAVAALWPAISVVASRRSTPPATTRLGSPGAVRARIRGLTRLIATITGAGAILTAELWFTGSEGFAVAMGAATLAFGIWGFVLCQMVKREVSRAFLAQGQASPFARPG